MRPILVLMLSLSGILGALGFPMLFTGTYLLGGSMAVLAVALSAYAFRESTREEERQREYDLRYREKIDALTEEILGRGTIEIHPPTYEVTEMLP